MSKSTTSSVVNSRARAYDFLVGLMGVAPDVLTWDSTHRLQGHAHHHGHELVVIATHEASHKPVVLKVEVLAVAEDRFNRCCHCQSPYFL